MKRAGTCLFAVVRLLAGGHARKIAMSIGDDSDLTTFVTRPDIKAPRFNVTLYDSQVVTPGYWFVSPYADISKDSRPTNCFQPCQIGPHIYDGSGELIWSGACLVENQNTCDFRAYNFNGSFYLSAILYSQGERPGRGILLDNSYEVKKTLYSGPGTTSFNMHELQFLENGNTALYLINRPEWADTSSASNATASSWLGNAGIRETDLVTNRTTFEWWAYPSVSPSESTIEMDEEAEGVWDWFHINAVNKNDEGDYIICARHTDSIYKVSGKDGRILWRLGGNRSDFQLDGVNFSRQHDARSIGQGHNYEMISLLDNGADTKEQTATSSSGLVIYLNKTTMSAHVSQRWTRPDQDLSRLRGNFQTLDNGNVFGGWSDNCYISEHTADGRLLMEASFESKRFVTYRAYKSNFTGNPSDRPILKAFAYGVNATSATTVFYVSWNGATEVSRWEFGREGKRGPISIGSALRSGFETRFDRLGYGPQRVYVEAVNEFGAVIGRSVSVEVDAPPAWRSKLVYPRPQIFDGKSEL